MINVGGRCASLTLKSKVQCKRVNEVILAQDSRATMLASRQREGFMSVAYMCSLNARRVERGRPWPFFLPLLIPLPRQSPGAG